MTRTDDSAALLIRSFCDDVWIIFPLCHIGSHQHSTRMADENILVIPRSLFEQLGAFQGFQSEANRYLRAFWLRGNAFFVPRSSAESDPSLKQLIPYCVFTHKGRVLRYTRGGKSGEQRLASKMSIGIGGHVNDQDGDSATFGEAGYLKALHREITEELNLGGAYTERVIGMINDDSNDVGRVHLGVVHLVELENDSVKPGEAAIETLEFVSRETLMEHVERLETWSQIVAIALNTLGLEERA